MSANTIFKYRDFEIEYNLSDYTKLEKWENALEAYEERRKELQGDPDIKNHQKLKNLVLAIGDFFDAAFGEDAANKILGETTNVDEALSAFTAAQTFGIEQSQERAERWNSAAAQFSPKNRAQLRAIKQ